MVCSYHDDNVLRAAVLDVLGQRLKRPRRQRQRRRVLADHVRLFVAHIGVPAFASRFAFAFAFTPSFLRRAPGLVLARLLAVRLVFSPYFERGGFVAAE